MFADSFGFSSGLELKVSLSRRVRMSVPGNPELREQASEGQSRLYGSVIKDEREILFKGMESPCLYLKSLADCSSLLWCRGASAH